MDLRELLRRARGAKEENRQKIIRAVMCRAGNQSDLVLRSGMSAATVSEAVRELSKAGIVHAERQGRDTFVRLAPTEGVAVGVELGYQKTVIVSRLAHQERHESMLRVLPVGAAQKEEGWLRDVANAVQELVAEFGDRNGLATIGVAVPRMVSPKTQRFAPPELPPWEKSRPPHKALEEQLAELRSTAAGSRSQPKPVPTPRIDNDANLGALAESVYVHSSRETLLYVKASTGVGAGICVSGRLFRGASGVAGEIGHLMVDPDGRFCLCGGRGCLETLIGADRLLDRAQTVIGSRRIGYRTLADLIDKAHADNALALRILKEAGTQLGFAIGNVCNIVNPNVVVIGGSLSAAGAHLLAPCREAIEATAMRAAYHPETGFTLELSTVEHSSAQGALLLGLQGTTFTN
ncbi:ROK family transcriptional regulator [Actinomadura sp. 7K534]|uniref:ROK family transcriptional regulator n=1 Tax=Actinomadura sp. 7K534 TaxID=2530366 RepID=UPI0010508ACC|nr:ROK family transcriptional regulator [Actinomadura sp. 7K534]TDB97928.1 ROK family transcriptional regulator [Actinomadura sp. 7K534]